MHPLASSPHRGWGFRGLVVGVLFVSVVGLVEVPTAALAPGVHSPSGGHTIRLASTTAGGWQSFPTPAGFVGLFSPSLASDPTDNGVILFGGCTSVLCTSATNATWLYSQGNWTKLAVRGGPSPRGEAQMTWDPADGSIVLFGGEGCRNPPVCDTWTHLNDTWTFFGGAWQRILTSVAPPPTIQGSLAFDPSGQQVVLFGGYGCFTQCTTWTYSGGTWTALNLSVSPAFRYDSGFAEDDADNGSLLFGGVASSFLADTWLFSHGAWHAIFTGAHPPVRGSPAMGFDASLGAVVLFGGDYVTLSNFPGVTYGDTWTFHSGTWVPGLISTATPAARTDAAGAVDPSSGVFVMAGGCGTGGCPETDSWGFGVLSPVGFNSSGGPCANFTLHGATHASGAFELLENASYAWTVSACPGYSLANVTAAGALTLTVGRSNLTHANGSVLVGGTGSLVANLTPILSPSSNSGVWGWGWPLTNFELALLGIGGAIAATLVVVLAVRRRRPPPIASRPVPSVSSASPGAPPARTR